MNQVALGALITDDGRRLPIDPVMLARGGEGAIYRLTQAEGFLAKIYTNPPDDSRVAKLRAMVASSSSGLTEAAAWPVGLILDQPGLQPRVVGFVMPEVVEHRELHQLFSPAERKRHFPTANWKMLALAGSNLARVVSAVHQAGAVIGDLNQNNVLVSSRATVRLIDCDSFQFRRSDGQYWTSDVGKEEYLPPELQSANLRGLVRSADHDNFALAVLIFQLLFMGRHPFSGRHQKPGDYTIGMAISDGNYFYGRDANRKSIGPPPGVITPAVLPEMVASAFEKAFLQTNRPAAREWSDILLQFANEMSACSESPRHIYYARPASDEFLTTKAAACPWCQLKNAFRIDYFPESSASQATGGNVAELIRISVDLDKLQSVIDSIPKFQLKYKRLQFGKKDLRTALPPPAGLLRPEKLVLQPEPEEPGPKHDNALVILIQGLLVPLTLLSLGMLFVRFFFGAIGIALCSALFAASRGIQVISLKKDYRDWLAEFEQVRLTNDELKETWKLENRDWLDEYSRRQMQRDEVLARLVERETQWSGWLEQIAGSDKELRKEARETLAKVKERLEDYQAELEEQARARQMHAVEAWLEGHLIRDANIPQIGRTRAATLASFGIETAADVVRLFQNQSYTIPGFGQRLMNNLWYWAADIQSRYKPDPAVALPLEVAMKIRARFDPEIQAMVQRVHLIIADLQGFGPLVESKRPKVEAFFQQTTREYLEAERDLKIME
ncbi:MAG: protein kinase domain-containing protein [bacterium]